jgi:shikimate O-hydroxycinnamoyltransferase
MFLSNLDVRWITFNNMKLLLFYKTESREEFCKIVETLKRSLSSVLVDFYPFAGRLDIQRGESGRPEVDCNDEGVEFVEASTDISFEDVEKDEFQHKSFFRELALTHANSYAAPLLSIQVTAFREGGICIGTTFHHAIADGNSFWYFMKCWAERSRGLLISKKPEHMRTVFKRDKKNYAIPKISFKSEEVVIDRVKGGQVIKFLPDDLLPMNSEPPSTQKDSINVITGAVAVKNSENDSIKKSMKDETELEISTFHFSEKMIRSLKERAQASSSFVAVAAHFWKCVMEARNVPEDQPVHIQVLADCRDQLKPPLPPTYFGNCICPGAAQTTAKQLLEQDICFAAGLIQEVINSCKTEVQLNNYIDWIEPRDLGCSNELDSDYSVIVVNSPKYLVYDIDYGWGKPLNVLPATIGVIGGMFLFPGRDGGRSIDFCTRLPRPHMETLKRILLVRADALSCRL